MFHLRRKSEQVTNMALARTAFPALAALYLAACGNAADENRAATTEVDVATTPPSVTFTPKGDTAPSGKPSGPITVAYRLIGKPVVGQPIAVDLRVMSTFAGKPVTLNYRINDTTALMLAESQPQSVTIAAGADEDGGRAQQVTVIPMREGRLYLNVSASVETEKGSMSTVTAIPIQVGDAPRTMQENGTLKTDDKGDSVRVLPAKEN